MSSTLSSGLEWNVMQPSCTGGAALATDHFVHSGDSCWTASLGHEFVMAEGLCAAVFAKASGRGAGAVPGRAECLKFQRSKRRHFASAPFWLALPWHHSRRMGRGGRPSLFGESM